MFLKILVGTAGVKDMDREKKSLKITHGRQRVWTRPVGKVFTVVQVRGLRGKTDYEPLVIIDDESRNESV